MKRVIHLIVAILLCLSLVSCSSVQNTPIPSPTPEAAQENQGTEVEPIDENTGQGEEQEKIIRIFCYNDEVKQIIEKFMELHPDFGYDIKIITEYAFGCIDRSVIVNNLMNGAYDMEPPDMFSIEVDYIYPYTHGSNYRFAAPYEELGIDVDTLVKEAGIPRYMVEAGTNRDGKLVALGYQNYAGAFIYRRSIAKKVWGTDDPDVIGNIIGPGWDKFLKAAADLKAKGYGICSGIEDIWMPFERNSEQGWIKDGDIVIDPKREAFLDYARILVENGYTNNTASWSDEWYSDMRGEGKKQIFGFFGPVWFVHYILESYSGGEKPGEGTYGDWAVCDPPEGFFWAGPMILANKNTKHKEAVGEIIRWITLDTSESGLQYLWATGAFGEKRDLPAAAAVAGKLECRTDFMGGQDLFEAYLSASEHARGMGLSEHDDYISHEFIQEAMAYANGQKSRNEAIEDFKKNAADRYAWFSGLLKKESTGTGQNDGSRAGD